MAVKRLLIEDFLNLGRHLPIFDVRSPGEYSQAHIPGAHTLPLLSDDERKVVGTAYKQQGRQKAIKHGLDFFGVKMRPMVEAVEKIMTGFSTNVSNKILVHCWRGGMRSGAVAWLLDLYGYEVYTLAGGYKAYRNWVLKHFVQDYDFKILGGYTGSGKTAILRELERNNQTVVDLEKLVNHKGSAFGGIGQGEQPTQEMFENMLATELNHKSSQIIWLEDESQRIGKLHIPHPLWKTMRTKPIHFVQIPFSDRLQYIIKEYGNLDKEQLAVSIERIQKRLGPLQTKTAITHLRNHETEACFSILLHYYDKQYDKALQNRENMERLLNKIPVSNVDSLQNAQKLILCSSASL